MSNKNYLLVTGSLYNYNGGPYLSVKSLANALAKRNSVTVIGSKDDRKEKSFVDGYFPENSKGKAIALNKYGKYHWHFTPSILLYKNINDFDVILLQAIFQINCWYIFMLSLVLKKQIIVSVRGELVDKNSMAQMKKRIFKPFIKFYLGKASYVHVLNLKEKQAVLTLVPKANVVVIPNGINENEIKNSTTKEKIILYLGRLHPIKNIENLILGFLSANISEYRLYIAGEGESEYETKLKNLCENNISIKFFGSVWGDKKQELLDSATFFILPSLSEGMPMAALEAMSRNLVCILSKECNMDEFEIRDACIIVGTSKLSISERLKYAVNLPVENINMISENASKLLKEKYLWNTIAENFEHLF